MLLARSIGMQRRGGKRPTEGNQGNFRNRTEGQELTNEMTERTDPRIAEWNQTGRSYEREASVGGLFTRVATANADRIAVEFCREQLTYGELERLSNQFARMLRRSCGVGAGDRVGVIVNRSLDLAVCLLGILKAGAAFVPYDRSEPSRRLHAATRNAELRMAIVDAEGEALPETAPAMELSEARRRAEREEATPVEWNAAATDPAYLMYTSGTTGDPKAVVIPHRGILRLVRNNTFAAMGPEETFLQMAPITFDASTFELWGALLNGGRLVMMPPGPPALSEIGRVIRERGITTLWLTAGLFHLMVNEAVEDLRPLRQLLAGGDRLSPSHVARALGKLEGTALINGYGPTETTTFACCHTITRADASGAPIPIGRPIANTQVHVLDEAMRPVPVGADGEIYIGGDGVALGYWRSAELTRERFVVDPFSREPGARMYRTFDRGRWREDGTLDFLGRADNQVKILGHRVEPEEIERALREHPLVRDAVVMAQESAEADKQLVAWVVEGEHFGITPGALRAHLASRLPSYMIPSSFVSIAKLPLTANGKVDRAELAAEELERKSQPEPEPASGGVEAIVAKAWCKVLGRSDVGRDENFFDAGGDSLRLIQLHSELGRSLSMNLDVTELFEFPTVAGLARRLANGACRNLDHARERAQRQRRAMGLGRAAGVQEAAG